jgi:protein-tyrosine phosphatase
VRRSTDADELHDPGADRDATRILFVCTANQCRSVLAEALARRRFAGGPFVFGSGGLLDGGRPMPPNGVLVAAEHDLDMSGHISRRVDLQRLDEWDLILTMSRRHMRELVAADARIWPRVFTLPQFRRWLDANPPGRHAALRSFVESAGAARSRSEMVGSRVDDEVADPIDGPPAAWRELVLRLTDDLDAIADQLLPLDDGSRQDRLTLPSTAPRAHRRSNRRSAAPGGDMPPGRP